MRRMLHWISVTSVCLFGASCAHDDGYKRPDMDSDATGGANMDSGAGGKSPHDAGPAPEPVDQTPPMNANGLAFDAEGMIWLADLAGNQVLRVDPVTGRILARFSQDGSGPDDVAIDAQGRVFWTGFFSGGIGRFDPKTKLNESIAQLPRGANSIAFTADGRLFVGLVLINHGLYEVDPEGMREPRLVTDAIGNLNAFDIGPDGLLWGPLDDAIVKIDLESGEVVETIAEGPYASVRYSERDQTLFAVTSGKDGKSPGLDKIDLVDHRVSRVSVPEVDAVDNLAIDGEGRFFVTGFDKPRIAVINPDGSGRAVLQIGAAAKSD